MVLVRNGERIDGQTIAIEEVAKLANTVSVLQFDADIPFFHLDKKGYVCPFQLQFLQSYADIPNFTASETTAHLCSLCSNHFVVHLLISNANIVN